MKEQRINFSWKVGQKIEDAIKAAIDPYHAKIYPNKIYLYEFDLSNLLVADHDYDFSVIGINKFAEQLKLISLNIVTSKKESEGIATNEYLGIETFYIDDNVIRFDDFSSAKLPDLPYNPFTDKKNTVVTTTKKPPPKPVIKASAPEPSPPPNVEKERKTVEIKFYELIGQPVLETVSSISFKTSVRSDIDLSTIVEFKEQTQVITTVAAAQDDKNSFSFIGKYMVYAARHIMNFKNPDAGSWVTIFYANKL
jgi:hypothetical protein